MKRRQRKTEFKGYNRYNFLLGKPLKFKEEDNGDVVAYERGYRLMLAHWLRDKFYEHNVFIVTDVCPMYKKEKEVLGKLLVKSAHLQLPQQYNGRISVTMHNSFKVVFKISNCIFEIESEEESKLEMYRKVKALAERINRPILFQVYNSLRK